MKNKLLRLLNLKFKTKYHSVNNLICARPEAIAYVPNPSIEELLSFFRVVSGRDRDDSLFRTVEKMVLKVIRKYPESKDSTHILDTILIYPEVLNTIHESEKNTSYLTFVRVLHRKVFTESATGIKTPELISNIQNPTFRMMYYAVRHEPTSLRLFKNPKNRLIEEAVRSDPSVIRFIEEPSKELKKLAIGISIKSLSYISNQDKTDCKYALSLNPEALKYIKPENRDTSMTESVLLSEEPIDFDWLTIRNFSKYKFSIEEIELMVKHGPKQLLSFLGLLALNGRVEVPARLFEEIENKLNIKLED